MQKRLTLLAGSILLTHDLQAAFTPGSVSNATSSSLVIALRNSSTGEAVLIDSGRTTDHVNSAGFNDPTSVNIASFVSSGFSEFSVFGFYAELLEPTNPYNDAASLGVVYSSTVSALRTNDYYIGGSNDSDVFSRRAVSSNDVTATAQEIALLLATTPELVPIAIASSPFLSDGLPFISLNDIWQEEALSQNLNNLADYHRNKLFAAEAEPGNITSLAKDAQRFRMQNTFALSPCFTYPMDPFNCDIPQLNYYNGDLVIRNQGRLQITSIPVPASAWLFGSALIGLWRIKR